MVNPFLTNNGSSDQVLPKNSLYIKREKEKGRYRERQRQAEVGKYKKKFPLIF